MTNFRARPHFEDRQIQQNVGESITLSGQTNFDLGNYNGYVYDSYEGFVTGVSGVTFSSLPFSASTDPLIGWDNQTTYQPGILRLTPPRKVLFSGNTDTISSITQEDVTDYIIKSVDSSGTFTWAPLSGLTSSSCTPNFLVTTIQPCTSGGTVTMDGNFTVEGNFTVIGTVTSATTIIQTEIVKVEDKNIELNYGGNHSTAVGGGITVLSGQSISLDSSIYTDSNGYWMFNPGLNSPTILSGATYLGDYSPTYTNRSLVDKEYVDSEITSNKVFTGGTGTNSITNIGDGSNVVTGLYAFAMGKDNEVNGNYSSAIGQKNTVGSNGSYILSDTSSVYSNGGGIFAGNTNRILLSAQNSVILGGSDNNIYSTYSGILGGSNNNIGTTTGALGAFCTILGGVQNTIGTTFQGSSIIGGLTNEVNSNRSAIIGGENNNVSGLNAIILGGQLNTVTTQEGSIIGGNNNSVTVNRSSILGGRENIASQGDGAIIGGTFNTISGVSKSKSVIIGGDNNTITGSYSSILGGQLNTVSGDNSVAIGSNNEVGGLNSLGFGLQNIITDNYGVGLGRNNIISAEGGITIGIGNDVSGVYSSAIGNGNTVSGNGSHVISNDSEVYSTQSGIFGGSTNTINLTSEKSVILGGAGNVVYSTNSGILGGFLNQVGTTTGGLGTNGAIVGGASNIVTVNAQNSVIIGGSSNQVGGNRSAVIGGQLNDVSGDYSVAIGGGGNTLTSSALRSVVLGGSGINGSSPDTVYMNNLSVQNTNGIFYSNVNGTTENSCVLSGNSNSLTFLEAKTVDSSSIRFGVRGSDMSLFGAYGKTNDSFLYSTINSNGLNIISADSPSGTEDYIRFYAGQNAHAGNTPDIHIQGTGSTRGFVGIATENPTDTLHVNGSFRLQDGTEQNGYVLTSDANGVGTWQSGGSGGGGGVTIDAYNDVGTTTTINWDVSGTSTNYEVTLNGAGTLNLTNVRNGDYGTIIVEQDGVGSRTLTFGTVNGGAGTHRVVNGGGGSPTLTSTPNTIDLLSFTYNGTTMYWTVGNDYT